MKLELKHLSPYLPYSLQWFFDGEEFTHDVVGLALGTEGLHLLSPTGDFGTCGIDKGKPVLRPMSDLRTAKLFDNYGDEKLTAIEEFYGNWDLTPYDWVLTEVSEGKQLERLLELPYKVIDKLLQHHFDVFGLIPAGLAIDINTLNK